MQGVQRDADSCSKNEEQFDRVEGEEISREIERHGMKNKFLFLQISSKLKLEKNYEELFDNQASLAKGKGDKFPLKS